MVNLFYVVVGAGENMGIICENESAKLSPSDDSFGQIIFGIQIQPTMAKKKPPVIFKGDTTITHLGEKRGPSAAY